MNGLMAYHAYIHTSDRHEYQHNPYSAKKFREACKIIPPESLSYFNAY